MPAYPTLPLRDTERVYGRITRLLHWSIAALLLWQFIGMALRLALGRHPVVVVFVGSHQKIGTVLVVLITLRVIWALANRGHRPGHGSGLLALAARFGHLLLYAVMMVSPVAALLRAYGSERPFAPFGFQIFAPQVPEIGWMVRAGDALHGEMSWLLLALVAGHVVMVGLHEGMWRDGTLARMVGRWRQDP
jgi:cytochrome b561